MILKREHFISSRINWEPKSGNLRSLSTELELGTDSFIFVDDSAVECAEVEARCPEVLALQLPEQETDIKRFLSHVWAFDHLKITEEDRRRSDLYAQKAKREQLLTESLSLEDFLAGLDLQVEFLPMTKAELPRVAQLLQRTNQFNFTTLRRSESEVEQLCLAGEAECQVIQLRDRFGDYGLVGAMIFTEAPRPAGCGQRSPELPGFGKAGRVPDAFASGTDCAGRTARESTDQLCRDSKEQTGARFFGKHRRNHSGGKRHGLCDRF